MAVGNGGGLPVVVVCVVEGMMLVEPPYCVVCRSQSDFCRMSTHACGAGAAALSLAV